MSYVYYAPRSMSELLDVLDAKKQGAMILAGGTDVMVDIARVTCRKVWSILPGCQE